jgi:hypothetical protein
MQPDHCQPAIVGLELGFSFGAPLGDLPLIGGIGADQDYRGKG